MDRVKSARMWADVIKENIAVMNRMKEERTDAKARRLLSEEKKHHERRNTPKGDQEIYETA